MAQHTSFRIYFLLTIFSLSYGNSLAREVLYSDFGAKGDGKTNDFAALKKAHDYANENGLPVKADHNATYYIGVIDSPIPIKTSTNFGKAKFIIDDTEIKNWRQHVFEILSSHEPIKLTQTKELMKSDTQIADSLPMTSLVIAEHDKVKQFIRTGRNQNSGSTQRDAFLVSKHGKIHPQSPLAWDFKNISKMTAYPMDQEVLSIKGGIFTTIAHSKVNTKYFYRGIKITRSNVTIEGLKHYIKGEGKDGPPYIGFIYIEKCANVTLNDVALSAHKFYFKIGSAGKKVPMGTYDLQIRSSINVSLINCIQTNGIMHHQLWGIMGTNFCKNLMLDKCSLSRFDAHQGVMNVTIRNSTIGRMGIKLIGSGTCLVENTMVKADNFFELRPDYGSTWNGDIIIKNCTFEPQNLFRNVALIQGSNDGQHDFGYETYLPQKVDIDNLTINDNGIKNIERYKELAVFSNINPRMTNSSYKQKHPQILPKTVVYRGVNVASSKTLKLSLNQFMFKNVKFIKKN